MYRRNLGGFMEIAVRCQSTEISSTDGQLAHGRVALGLYRT
jgi:hypothetical protein